MLECKADCYLRCMSPLLITATTYKANTVPIVMVGLGLFLLSTVVSYRDQARKQRAAGVGGNREQRVKWLERGVIGCVLLMVAGIIWILVEVSNLH